MVSFPATHCNMAGSNNNNKVVSKHGIPHSHSWKKKKKSRNTNNPNIILPNWLLPGWLLKIQNKHKKLVFWEQD